jgi:hypothetical protein
MYIISIWWQSIAVHAYPHPQWSEIPSSYGKLDSTVNWPWLNIQYLLRPSRPRVVFQKKDSNLWKMARSCSKVLKVTYGARPIAPINTPINHWHFKHCGISWVMWLKCHSSLYSSLEAEADPSTLGPTQVTQWWNRGTHPNEHTASKIQISLQMCLFLDFKKSKMQQLTLYLTRDSSTCPNHWTAWNFTMVENLWILPGYFSPINTLLLTKRHYKKLIVTRPITGGHSVFEFYQFQPCSYKGKGFPSWDTAKQFMTFMLCLIWEF